MKIPEEQLQKTYTRWTERTAARAHNLEMIRENNYFKADSPVRVEKFLARRGFSPQEQRELIQSGNPRVPSLTESKETEKKFLRLERILGNNDLVGMPFLLRALQISKTVGRIWISNQNGALVGYGTGFLVGPGLLLTNNHVLPQSATAGFSFAEFNYEMGADNSLLTSEVFRLLPSQFYFTDEDLDYTMVAVDKTSRNGTPLMNYGWNVLSREEGKAIISQWLNVIEHPDGQPKQVGLRENQLIDVLENFLHYKTDTAPGASGSPVFNEQWEVVGIHHSGVYDTDSNGNILAMDGQPWKDSMGEDNIKWIANEGIRISRVLRHMDARSFSREQQQLYDQISTAPQLNPLPIIENKMERNNQNGPSVNIDNNGTISWTFPVTLSINIGGGVTNLGTASSGQSTASAAAVIADTSLSTTAASTENEILAKARETFGKRPDVIGVRMGYVFRNGWITKERAIVVTVEKRKSIDQLNKENNSALPRTFLNYPVEITGPTLEQMLQKKVGMKTFESLMVKKPPFQLESRYFPPTGANVKLEKIIDNMKVIAHVSPEQGWSNLSSFLDATEKSLTIAMYDFGATHIIEKIDELAPKTGFQKFTLTLQPGESVGEGTKANDVKDEEAVEDFENNFGNKFRNAWVHIGSVNGWVNSSYHIKVAVRDNNAIHLSSGNYQSSNQPDIDSLPDQRQSFLLRTYNREWHAIVEHEELAKKYELYIQHDFENNKATNVDEMALLEGVSLLVPVDPLLTLEAAPQVKAFAPFEDEREFTVTPLLTPDNFLKELLPVIESATTELYIQNQTFNAPKDGNAELEQLIDAVLQKQQQGVDVKIIFRVIIAATARENIEKLVDRGFDPASIRTYSKCHTKGVIVDGKTVLLGSQNWSQDGISVNRDASLLFEDEPLAKYFREIFLHDWNNLSKSSIGRESLTLEVAQPGAEVPPGMELMTWKELREYL